MLRKLIGLSTVLTLVFGLGLSVDAGADYASNKTKNYTPIHQTVLEPGWRMSCSSDFVIEISSNITRFRERLDHCN